MISIKRTLIIVGFLLVTACTSEPELIIDKPIVPADPFASSSSATSVAPASKPASVRINVPFAAQAPFADWSDPRQQEGCEEMSVIMVHHYLEGTTLSNQEAYDELMAMSAWQTEHGYGLDVSIVQMKDIIEAYYDGYEVEIIEEVTPERIKQEIDAGNPVIVPAAGRMLQNPYFSGEGPFYHMLVIIGYDNKHFITNDPGTKRGAHYAYDQAVLMDAIHDWTGVKEETHTGEKRMLVIRKP